MSRPVPEVYFRTRFRAPAPHPAWPARFAIVSAHATTGETWSEARNGEADGRLRAELEAAEVWHARVTGYDGEGDHAEASWAVALPRGEALDLARRYRQLGIFEVVGGTVWIVMTDEGMADEGMTGEVEAAEGRAAEGAVARLGAWSERLDPPAGPGARP